MTNIHFEDVNVKYSSWYSAKGRIPFYDRRFYCEHASGTAINSNIAPPCLKKTSASASASASRPSSAATIALN